MEQTVEAAQQEAIGLLMTAKEVLGESSPKGKRINVLEYALVTVLGSDHYSELHGIANSLANYYITMRGAMGDDKRRESFEKRCPIIRGDGILRDVDLEAAIGRIGSGYKPTTQKAYTEVVRRVEALKVRIDDYKVKREEDSKALARERVVIPTAPATSDELPYTRSGSHNVGDVVMLTNIQPKAPDYAWGYSKGGQHHIHHREGTVTGETDELRVRVLKVNPNGTYQSEPLDERLQQGLSFGGRRDTGRGRESAELYVGATLTVEPTKQFDVDRSGVGFSNGFVTIHHNSAYDGRPIEVQITSVNTTKEGSFHAEPTNPAYRKSRSRGRIRPGGFRRSDGY